MFDMMSGGDTLAKYPKLKGLKEKVEALPAIKKWLEVRPKTEF
jgi:glutathione S-transferase